MKKILRVTGIGLLLVLGALQFYRSPRNLGATEGPESIVAREQVPANVRQILARACYDCHSDNTRYPWYAAVQPVAWWLNDHVTEGKSELNFSAFAAYDAKRAVRKLQEVSDEVRERNMPLKSYLLAHPEAKLTDADVAVLTTWAEDLADEIGSR
ncbi:MAG TPA: heme-binding domain-containing protein [Lacunisphaera sp.]